MLELQILGIHSDGQHQPIVLLQHEDRVLPIAVGLAEAEAIHYGLITAKFPRPMTHDLVCNILAGLRGTLESVTIYKLENSTFFAHLNVRQQTVDGAVEQVLRIDSRPSDGIAIAVRQGVPIYAAEEVMAEAGQDITILQGDEDEDEDGDEGEMDDDLDAE